jgi:hypothetical protein
LFLVLESFLIFTKKTPTTLGVIKNPEKTLSNYSDGGQIRVDRLNKKKNLFSLLKPTFLYKMFIQLGSKYNIFFIF